MTLTTGATKRSRAAYHEAGHAVMVHLLGGVVSLVTLEPHAKRAGCTYFTRFRSPRLNALVAAAGSAAETLRFGRHQGLGASDRAILRESGISAAEDAAVLELARKTLAGHGWSAVTAVASYLETHDVLEGTKVHELARKHDVRPLVREAAGEVSTVDTRIGTDGVEEPARKARAVSLIVDASALSPGMHYQPPAGTTHFRPAPQRTEKPTRALRVGSNERAFHPTIFA